MKSELSAAVEAGLIIDDMEQYVNYELGEDFYDDENNSVNFSFLYGEDVHTEYRPAIVEELRKQYNERKLTYDKKGMN